MRHAAPSSWWKTRPTCARSPCDSCAPWDTPCSTPPDAKAALQLLTDHPDISLLFSDVVLGSGMNGIELAQAAQRLRPGLPVLLASGYEGGGLPHEPAQSSAPYELLRKPYQREQLTEAVQRILRLD